MNRKTQNRGKVAEYNFFVYLPVSIFSHQNSVRMKQVPIWIAIIILTFQATAQRNTDAIIDTLETSDGPVILFKNFTWEYLRDEPYMLTTEDDSTGILSEQWITQSIFTYRMKPDSIRDTLLTLVSPSRKFTMPFYGKLFRGFTYSHKGLDIKLNKGDSIRCAFDGVVRYAKYNRGGFGNLIIVRHYNGLETYYSHLSRIMVKPNQVVTSGEIIGLGGSTGRSRGPHLHFEVRYKDVPLDPMRMIDYDNQKLISENLPVVWQIFYPNDHVADAVVVKIKSGDTLGKLARKYGTSVKEICAMNKIKPTTTLRIGRTIRVR